MDYFAKSDGVIIRLKPSLDSKAYKKVKKGSPIYVVKKHDKDWYVVSDDNYNYYALSKDLEQVFIEDIIKLEKESSKNKASQRNYSKLDEKYGFRDAVLESDISTFENLVVVEEDNGQKICQRTSDKLEVGDYELKGITYVFYKDKLSTIILTTEGLTNSRGLFNIIQTQYGNGFKSNQYLEGYVWTGKRTNMVYDQNSITDDASLFIISKPMSKLKENGDKESIKKGISDF